MERRSEIRFKADGPVTVTVLDPSGQTPLIGMLVDVAGRGMRLDLPCPLPYGTPVKVETEGALLLAEVLRCEQHGESHRVAFSIEHGLDVVALRQLNRSLLGLDPEEVPESSPSAA